MSPNRRRRKPTVVVVAAAALSAGMPLLAGPALAAAVPGPGLPAGQHWVGTWGAALQSSSSTATEQTFREIVHTAIGGATVRIRVSNVFGTQPLTIGAASIGVRSSGADLVAGTGRALSFAGSPSVTLAPGTETWSDPAPLSVVPREDLAVSLYVAGASGPATQHPLALTTSYRTPTGGGDHSADQSGAAFTQPTSSWWFLQGVDVLAPEAVSTVVAVGDSITDGYQTTSDADARWTDVLNRRLAQQPGGQPASVVNMGITGNEVTMDRPGYGVSVTHRLQRDVLEQAGVQTVVLFEGINDIGNDAVPVAAIEAADTGITRQLHAAGLRVVGATLTPSGGSVRYGVGYSTPAGLAERDALNAWIRTSGVFDAVIDFDAAVRDGAQPENLAPAYDSGDHLHPGDAGQTAMGNAVDVALLQPGTASPGLPEATSPALLLATGLAAAGAVGLRRRRRRSRGGPLG